MGGNLFKGESVRISTSDVLKVAEYIKEIVPFSLCTLVGGVTADIVNKEEHGDVDFVVLAPEEFDPSKILEHPDVERFVSNGYVQSYLINIPEIGKCHIDLLWTTSQEDYDLKLQYHQGGTATARFVGQLARSLGYKWTSNGFFRHVQDARGNYHYFLMTKDLITGMRILGLNVTRYQEGLALESPKHFIEWITNSRRFYPSKWIAAHHHSHRKSLKQKDDWIKEIHEAIDNYEVDEDLEDFREYWDNFAGVGIQERLDQFMEEVNKIVKPVFNGEKVLALGIKPGPIVGKILSSLTEQFPDGTDDETFRAHALQILEQEEKENEQNH